MLLLLACAAPVSPPEDACVPSEETCNGRDDDCDGRIDDYTGDTWYADADGDGFGTDTWTLSCGPREGLAPAPGDCDDGDPDVSPGAAEQCGGADEDCDGLVDETDAVGCADRWSDADGDGLGAGDATCACEGVGVTTGGDCDDADPDLGADCTEGPVVEPDVVLLGAEAHDVAGWRIGAGPAGLLVSGNGQITWLLPEPTSGSAPALAAATFEGGAWMTRGDLDGDAAEELVFVLPDDADRWVTYVFSPPFSGTVPLDAATWSHTGPAADYLGWYNAVLPGDVDADGRADLLLGWHDTTEDRMSLVSTEEETPLFTGRYLGTRVAAGDYDGDGALDLALGEGEAEDAVMVFAGPATTVREERDADATLALSPTLLEPAGDADGDGYDDLLVGEAGRIWIVPGPVADGTPGDVAFASVGGEDAEDLQYPAASARDLDGDGRSELLVGDLQRATTGAAYLLWGPVTGTQDLVTADLRLVGEATEDFVGGAVALEDGWAWIGARGVDAAAYDAGAVYGVRIE